MMSDDDEIIVLSDDDEPAHDVSVLNDLAAWLDHDEPTSTMSGNSLPKRGVSSIKRLKHRTATTDQFADPRFHLWITEQPQIAASLMTYRIGRVTRCMVAPSCQSIERPRLICGLLAVGLYLTGAARSCRGTARDRTLHHTSNVPGETHLSV